MNDRVQAIEERLRAAFSPRELLVKDQSHLHAGHAGAQDGRGHYEVLIVSDEFGDTGRLQRHRMVFDALGEMMDTDIHAVRVRALTPEER